MIFLSRHIYLSHIPVVLMPICLLFFLYFSFTKNILAKRFILKVFIFSNLILLPIYLSGLKSSDLIEDFPGVNQSVLEIHSNYVNMFFLFTALSVFSALVFLFLQSKKIKNRVFAFLSFLLFITSIELFLVMSSGMKIRHTEVRDTNQNFRQTDGS